MEIKYMKNDERNNCSPTAKEGNQGKYLRMAKRYK